MDEVPVVRIVYLSDPRKRALMLAENRIVLNAGWEIQILAAELAELSSMELDLDIDPTGFEMGEIDVIFDGARGQKDDVPEVAPLPVPDLPRITLRGNIWRLGPHGIMCGDALSTDDLDSLMQDDVAAAGFVDPPYNVRVNGHVSGKGQFRHREFVQGSGELSKEAFGSFLSVAFSNGARVSRDGAVWFACMDWRHIDEMLGAGRRAFGEMLNLCVWGKINGGMGLLYRSQHELVFVFRTGRAGHRNSVQLGRFGRNRTNLWACSGVNVFRPGRTEDLHAHPTARPVAMVRDALMDVSARGDIVLDTFLGAGATLMAAHDCGRLARGLELDPLYVDVALRRWRGATGEEPAHRDDAAAIA